MKFFLETEARLADGKIVIRRDRCDSQLDSVCAAYTHLCDMFGLQYVRDYMSRGGSLFYGVASWHQMDTGEWINVRCNMYGDAAQVREGVYTL